MGSLKCSLIIRSLISKIYLWATSVILFYLSDEISEAQAGGWVNVKKPSEPVSARVGFCLLCSNQRTLHSKATFQHIPWQDFSSVNNLNPFLQLQSKLPTVFLQKWSQPPLRVWHSSISVTGKHRQIRQWYLPGIPQVPEVLLCVYFMILWNKNRPIQAFKNVCWCF